MTKKQKKMLLRILIAAVMLVLAIDGKADPHRV